MKSKVRVIEAVAERVEEVYIFAKSESLVNRTLIISYGPGVVQNGKIVVKPNDCRDLTIQGEDYDELMSESPEWAPNKPAGTYRDEDLLAYLDVVEERVEKRVSDNKNLHKEVLEMQQRSAEKAEERRLALIAEMENRAKKDLEDAQNASEIVRQQAKDEAAGAKKSKKAL